MQIPDPTHSVADPSDKAGNDDYDSPWKDAITRYFPEFMAFFFPEAYSQIDWSKGYQFLDQEMHAVLRDAAIGKRLLDKLAVVTLLTGETRTVYVHTEVQGTPEVIFPKRMYSYNYRIFDHYDRPVASMAVLADDNPRWRPTEFKNSVLGCQTGIQFPIAKLLDYLGHEAELEDNPNPFALFTLAHLQTMQTRHNDEARYQARWHLVQLLYKRNWDEQRVIDLLFVIDWMMKLPKHLEQALWQNVKKMEEEKKMAYVSSLQRYAIEEGMQKGMMLGMEQGLEQGRRTEATIMLERLLKRRFGTAPQRVHDRLADATADDLENWFDRAITAGSLAEVFGDASHVVH